MSNIYQALEQAGREKTTPGVTPELALPSTAVREVALSTEMTWLHHQVDSLLENRPNKLIQFVGSRRGEGVSTLVREFAKVAVERHGKSVLILDSAYQDPAQRININVTCEYGWTDLIEEGKLAEKAFFRVGESNLYFAPISVQTTLVSPINGLSTTLNVWQKLKEKFDLIIIDSSSDGNVSESAIMSRYVDGVILVLEAERTRRTSVEKVKKMIHANGGNILGVIFNKRQYHIPKKVYEKLFD